MRTRLTLRVGPMLAEKNNGRRTLPAARAEFSGAVLLRRYRGCAGALHRRHRFPHPRADRYPAAYGRIGTARRKCGRCGKPSTPAIPAFATRGPSAGRGRQGRGLSARVLHQAQQARVMQFDVAVFYTLRDGQIAQIREILDSFDLVQQVLETDVAAVLAGNAGWARPRSSFAAGPFGPGRDRRRPSPTRHLFPAALNLTAPARDLSWAKANIGRRKHPHEDCVARAAGSVLGALGGAALGIGAGLAWVEIFKTTRFRRL